MWLYILKGGLHYLTQSCSPEIPQSGYCSLQRTHCQTHCFYTLIIVYYSWTMFWKGPWRYSLLLTSSKVNEKTVTLPTRYIITSKECIMVHKLWYIMVPERVHKGLQRTITKHQSAITHLVLHFHRTFLGIHV